MVGQSLAQLQFFILVPCAVTEALHSLSTNLDIMILYSFYYI